MIKSLSLDTQDTLMKYLYKGMAMPGWGDVSGSVLLGWHEKVCGRWPACAPWVLIDLAVDGGCGCGLHRAHND